MPASVALLVAVLLALFLGLSLLLPAGYGLPSPVWAFAALLFTGPAWFGGWLLYRRAVRRGEVRPLSAPDEPITDYGQHDDRPSARRHGRAMRERGRH